MSFMLKTLNMTASTVVQCRVREISCWRFDENTHRTDGNADAKQRCCDHGPDAKSIFNGMCLRGFALRNLHPSAAEASSSRASSQKILRGFGEVHVG